MRLALPIACLALLCTASPAAGHSVMKIDGGTIVYTANDDVSLNDTQVTFQGDDIRFVDRGADGGISPPPDNSCSPGETDTNGYIVEVLCPRAGMTSIRIDVGEAQDKVTAQIPLVILVIGGRGADTVTTGDGNDIVNGGEGNDTVRSGNGNDQIVGEIGDDTLAGEAGDDSIQAALGADTVDGGPGNDDVKVRDGAVDRAVCGDGTDHVQSDADDQLDGCETIDAAAGTAPPPANGEPAPGPAPPDTTPPRVRAGGSTLQHVGRAASVEVLATSSEVSELVGGGYVTIGEDRLVLRSARAEVRVGGGGLRLRLTLSARDARKLRRFLRKRRRATATITVVATDQAGNSSASKLPPIRLRR